MSTVEITNVGGSRPRDGVASEATLQDLVRVLNTSGQPSAASRLQERFQRDHNQEVGRLTGEYKGLRQAASGLTSEFVVGGDRLSDFSEHVLKTNGILQRLIRFSDGLVDQFREFSSVGASFNNNIFDMKTSALQAAMNLDSFQQLIMNNSDTLRLFGSSVTDGAKRFTQLSRQFRNLNPQFFDMGFTIEDINAGLMNYTELLVKTGRVEQINSVDMLTGSAAYMKQLDLLAKVTGQSREALARQSEDINNDARMRAILARSGGENADALSQNAATVMAFAPGLKDSFLNLMDGGVALDSISQLLGSAAGSAGQELMELFQNAEDIDPDEFAKKFAELGPEAARFINSTLDRALVEISPEFKDFANSMAPMAALTYARVEAAKKEQAQTETVTSTLAGFSQTIQELKSFIVDEIIDSEAFSALGTLGESLSSLVSPTEEGSIPNFQGTLTTAINALVGPTGIITQAINWVNDLIKPENNDFGDRITQFTNTLITASGKIVDFFLGKEINVGGDDATEVDMQRQGGLFANMTAMFNDVFSEEREGSLWTKLGSILADGFSGIFKTLGKTLVETFELEGEESESPWTTISNSVQEKILSWLESGEFPAADSFWNRAWTAVGDRILNLLNVERNVDVLEIDTPVGPQVAEVPATFWQTIYDTILEQLGVVPANQSGNFWSTVWNKISTVSLGWLESDTAIATGDFWNRAWTAVGDRILNLLNVERSVDVLEIDTPVGPQTAEVPATFWQTIYDTILEQLGLAQVEGENQNLIERIGDKFVKGWETFFDGPIGTRLVDTIGSFFEFLIDELKLYINESSGGLVFSNQAEEIRTNRLRDAAEAGSLSEADLEHRNELLALDQTRLNILNDTVRSSGPLLAYDQNQYNDILERMREFSTEIQMEEIAQGSQAALEDYFGAQAEAIQTQVSAIQQQISDFESAEFTGSAGVFGIGAKTAEQQRQEELERILRTISSTFDTINRDYDVENPLIAPLIAELGDLNNTLQTSSDPLPTAAIVNETTDSYRRIGTLQATGMRSEPKDTVAQIHAGERVLNAEETNEYNNRTNQNNQRPMLEKLDQLNSTMMTVASLLTQELSIQTRTMNRISGLGPDLMKGMP